MSRREQKLRLTGQQNREEELLARKEGKWFIYENHSWDDEIFYSRNYIRLQDRFCGACLAADKLIAVCETQEEFDKVLQELLMSKELIGER